MKLGSISAGLHALLFLFLISHIAADLRSDKQALLNFAARVPHVRKLNWNGSTPVCASWVGVTCNRNGSRVVALRLPGVGLFGPIPTNTIQKLDSLMVLSFRSNQLSGNLPSDILSLPSLRYVYLQNNNFSGEIPSSLSPQLTWIDLSSNSISGNIPTTVQNLTRLVGVNLGNNSLTGSIPDFDLPRLKQLNLSYNQLNGSIPSSLKKFSRSSFAGNINLCGPPLMSCFPVSPAPSPSADLAPPPVTIPEKPKESHKKKVLSTGAIIGIAVAGGLLLLLLLILLVMCCCWKKKNNETTDAAKAKGKKAENPKEDFGSGVQEAEKNKLVFFEGSSYGFDLEDLLRASAEVLGKGSYGTTYKAILEEGTTVVVKRLKEVIVGKKEFDQQMETVGRISQHPNVVPIRAYYYSKDEKLLVYDFIAAGSFSALLHGIVFFNFIFF